MAVRKKDANKVSVQEAKEAFQAGTATDEQLDACIESAKQRAARLMKEYREVQAELAKYKHEKENRLDARIAKVVDDAKNVRLCSYTIYDREFKDFYDSYDYKLNISTGEIFSTHERHVGERSLRPDVEICSVDYFLKKYDIVTERIERNRFYGKIDAPLSDENRELVDSREIRRKSFEYWKKEGYDIPDTTLEPKGSAKKDRSFAAESLFGDIVNAAKQSSAEVDVTKPGE